MNLFLKKTNQSVLNVKIINKFTHDNLNDVKNLLKLNKAINNKKVKLTQTELKAFDSLLKS